MLAEGLGKESEVVADGFALDQRAIEFAPVSYTHLTLPTSDLV